MGGSRDFVERFAAFGRRPDRDAYVALFAPGGTVQHPGMPVPVTGAGIAEFIAGVLDALPDFRFAVRRWQAAVDTLFVEATNSASFAGAPASWGSVYVITLYDGCIRRGRSYSAGAGRRRPLERRRAARPRRLPRHGAAA